MSARRTWPTVGWYMQPCPHTIGRDQTLAHAHAVMRAHGFRHLPVLEDGKLVGVVSSRDLYLIETLRDVDPERVTVVEAMTPDPYAVTPETPLATVTAAMAAHHYGCAVVTDRDARVVGIFTAVDALAILTERLGGDAPRAT
jgi:acetoin utilization protein AcuB